MNWLLPFLHSCCSACHRLPFAPPQPPNAALPDCFPSHRRCHTGISEASVPAELFPQYCTIEYSLPRQGALSPPAYVFVLDTCVAEDELLAARTAVQQALTMVPEYAQVGAWSREEVVC